MNKLKARILLSLVVGHWAICTVQAQTLFPEWSVAMNFGPLMSGTPELQVERKVYGRYAAILAGGQTYKTTRTGCAVDDGTTLDRQRGGFIKAGMKVRLFCLRRSCNQMHLQLQYVGSLYNEQGTAEHYAIETREREAIVSRGLAHGLATSAYWDLGLYRALRMRFGLQLGYYWRPDRFGMACQNCQPGLGASYPILPTQAILGLAHDIGVSDRWKSTDRP